ncbi:HCL551Cp [Eremothecium sinecaudum]|uniref:Peroxisomal membrane protein PEX13 n=1 Tax=Eremothecium sinecaudum TaxID=45286 RepID=A0A109UW15_9SACH|nr:HCL551Cp [Eremothecium sinecaudum]AMD19600.1 HCL551Cp [Eremothecium sinecaudum]
MSVSQVRPKPWETANAGSLSDIGATMDNFSIPAPQSDNSGNVSVGGDAPSLPAKPSNIKGDLDYREPTQPYHMNAAPYGGSMFQSGGMYGGSMYGGGYGSLYNGAYGSMYGGGAGGMYGGGYGLGGYGNNANGSSITESTQTTFHLIENMIAAVTSFAQMLEATYVATHNSFVTMVSVAEQFHNVREMLGSLFGIFAIIKFLKKILYKITGGKMGIPSNSQITQNGRNTGNKMLDEFNEFRVGRDSFAVTEKRAKPISWKPLIVFMAAVFGFPWLLNKFIFKLQEMQRAGRIGGRNNQELEQLDFSKLQFARALYDFVPENPNVECALKKGDLMAIISKLDTAGNDSQWWKVRTKKGDLGYVPSNYLELIMRTKETATN